MTGSDHGWCRLSDRRVGQPCAASRAVAIKALGRDHASTTDARFMRTCCHPRCSVRLPLAVSASTQARFGHASAGLCCACSHGRAVRAPTSQARGSCRPLRPGHFGRAAAIRARRLARASRTGSRRCAVGCCARAASPELDDWLRTAARSAGFDALVSFETPRAARTAAAGPLPAADRGRELLAAFTGLPHPLAVGRRAFGAWNEGNHVSQPQPSDPAAAARLYETLAGGLPGVPILAAELLDIPEHARVASVASAPRWTVSPRLWGLHNYSDVTRGAHGDDRRCWPRSDGSVCGSPRPVVSSATRR